MRQKAGEWLKKEKRKMNYTEKTKPGMGDPYWYEWSVGEQQIINMLTISPGKKMDGMVGFEAPKDWKTMEIHFKDDVWSNSKFKFEIEK